MFQGQRRYGAKRRVLKVAMLIHAISRRLQLHQQFEIMEWVQLPKMTDGLQLQWDAIWPLFWP